MIVAETDKAYDALFASGFTVSKNDVVGVEILNEPGAFANLTRLLFEANISVEYVYAFILKSENAFAVLKTSEDSRAQEILKLNGYRRLTLDAMLLF